MARRTVAIAVDSNTAGGAERFAVTLANGLSRLDCDVTLINSDADSCFTAPDPAVHVVKMALDIPADGAHALARARAKRRFIKKWLAKNRPDALVPFLIGMEVPCVGAARSTDTRVFCSVRNSPRFYSELVKRFRGLAYPRVAGVVFQSEAVRRHPDFSMARNTAVIPNMLESALADDTADPVPFEERTDRIISVGRLADQKQPLLLLEAFVMVADKHPATTLEYFGKGPLAEAVQERADELGLADRVKLHGVVPDAVPLNRDARLFVLASQMEGFPNALLEAMAVGLPVISTDFDTRVAAELIDEGENGWLVPVGDVDALADKIDHVLSLGPATDEVARRATAVRQTHAPEAICRQWRDFLFPED